MNRPPVQSALPGSPGGRGATPGRCLARWIDAPVPLGRLSTFRALYCLAILATLLLDRANVMRKAAAGFYDPVPTFEWLGIGPLSQPVMSSLLVGLVASLACAAAGLFARRALLASVVLYFLYMGNSLGYTKSPHTDYVFHSTNIVLVVLLVLALAPGVSRQGLLAGAKRVTVPDGPPAGQVVPIWPFHCIMLALGLAYFGSAYCKLVANPLWIDGETLQTYLIAKWLITDNILGWWLAHSFPICLVLGIVTILIEAFFVVLVFMPRWRWVAIVGGLGLHAGIYATMEINFFKFFGATYLVFVDPQALRRHAGAAVGRVRRFIGARAARIPRRARTVPAGRVAGLGWGLLVTATVGIVLAASVFLRVEAWPLTDYRVYEKRRQIGNASAYRLAGRTVTGEREWLSFVHLPAGPTVITTRCRKSIRVGDYGLPRDLLRRTAALLRSRDDHQFSRVVLIRRGIVTDGAGGFRPVDVAVEECEVIPSGHSPGSLPARIVKAREIGEGVDAVFDEGIMNPEALAHLASLARLKESRLLRRLSRLDLSAGRFPGPSTRDLAPFRHLEVLALPDSLATVEMMKFLQRQPRLRELDLASCCPSAAALSEAFEIGSLERLVVRPGRLDEAALAVLRYRAPRDLEVVMAVMADGDSGESGLILRQARTQLSGGSRDAPL